MSRHDRHEFSVRDDGLLWCNQENVPSDFCSDESRCSNECVCNVGDPDVLDRHVKYNTHLYRLSLEAGTIQEAEVLGYAVHYAKRELEDE